MRKTFFIILLGMLVGLNVFSQKSFNKKVIKYSLKEGLSFGIINSIIQDDKGFMWFATSDGLNRFDGIDFKVFKYEANNPQSLPSNYVQIIFKDVQGDIWIASRRGIYMFDTNTEQFNKFNPIGYESKLLNDISSISSDGKDILWFSSFSTGIFSYNKATHHLKNYNKNNSLNLSTNSIINVFKDSQGLLWAGTQDGIIYIHSVKNGAVLNVEHQVPLKFIPKGRINAIYEDHYHNVWIATSKGLALYCRTENKIYVFEGSKYHLRSNYFYSLLEDNNNNLLIGLQDGGLYKLDLEQLVRSNFKEIKIEPVKSEDNYNITERSIQTLYLDKDKNVWVGTYGDGIYMISNTPENFKKFQSKVTDAYGTSFLRYYGMCLDNEGNLWLGTDGDGIYKKKLNGEILKHYYADGKKGSLTDNAILYAGVDHLKNLWFGSYAKGLFRYDKKNDKFINYLHQDANRESLCSNDVRVIFEDSGNDLWVGTNGGGISVLPCGGNKFTNYNEQNSSIGNNNIRAICEDKQGNLFIGTYASGLKYFIKKQHKFINYFSNSQVDEFLPSQVIYSLYLYKNNELLIGTEGDGLVVYNIITKKFKKYTEKDGLANNTINAIHADEAGNIWVSTNKGLSKIEESTNAIINYDTSDGLQTGQFNPNAVLYSDKDKFLCLGGTEGYNIFYPSQVKKNNFKPKVLITGLQLFDKKEKDNQNRLSTAINVSQQITLTPGQSVFSIQYVALNYAYAERSEFAYKLVGLDKSWNYVGNQKSAVYRYLEPGNYIFKVKASNQDGIWFDDYATLKIKILPPWYKTWWAYSGYFLGLVMVIYYYLSYRNKQAKLKYEIRIAHISAEKDKELNERKLSFFTNISHEFRTPLTLIINPVKELMFNNDDKTTATNNLHIVYRNARRLLSLVDQLLLFRKADSEGDQLKVVKLNIVSLCKEVFLCFNYQANKKKINYEFISDTETIEIYADREKMEIVLFNLISNALKFTPNHGKVSCLITEDQKQVAISIKDSGCGIASEEKENLFNRFYQVQNKTLAQGGFGIGLYLVKKFIDSHKGIINLDSIYGEGTVFTLNLLKGKDHMSPNFIFEDIAENSFFLDELIADDEDVTAVDENLNKVVIKNTELIYSDRKSMLIVEDNAQIRHYLRQIFEDDFEVFEADNGTDGFNMAGKLVPDMIISDVLMNGLSGIELCNKVKEEPSLNHIPVILLTASSSPEIKLKGIEGGADDYITKPFEKNILIARVAGLLKSKNNLHKYFYNEITLQSNNVQIPPDYKEFLDRCISIVEQHLDDKDFCIKQLAYEVGMGHSNLYKKIKSISGRSANEFIRLIRLRKAAGMLLNTKCTVAEAAYKVGISDPKYFREQFSKLFGFNPSEYIKKFRQPFQASITRSAIRSKKN